MRLLLALLVWILWATLVARTSLVLENLALRQQLATYARTQKRPLRSGPGLSHRVGDLQCEAGPSTPAVALRYQRAPYLFRGQGAVV
jgi:hypothetical protein